MPRQGPMLQRVASILAVASFGLMFLAGARLLLSGPVMQRVIAAIPQPFSESNEEGETPDDLVRDGDQGQDSDLDEGRANAPSRSEDGGTANRDSAGGAPLTSSSTDNANAQELEAATAPGLRVVKRRISAEIALVGETVEFEISVSNIGDMPLTEIGVADVFDTPYMAFLDAQPAPSRLDEVGGRIEWSGLGGGPLLPGESTLVRARFEAIKAAPKPYRPFNAARASAREQNLTDGPSIAVVQIEEPDGLCVGNLVFQELVDDGRFDPADGDQGIAGVALTLYEDADGNGALSANDRHLDQILSDGEGRYAFCNLAPGSYVVAVDASNFDAGRPLALLTSSRAGASQDVPANPNDNVDHDDNGAAWLPSGSNVDSALDLSPRTVASRAIQLSMGDEPSLDQDGDDENQNSTLDFGFALPRVTEPGLPESPDRAPPPVEPTLPGSPEEPEVSAPPEAPDAGITGGPPPSVNPRPGKPVHGKPVRRGDQAREGGGPQLGATSLQGRGCAHVVGGGESVDSIAWAHGLSPWALATHNKLVHPGLIRVGQVLDLCVPGP